MIQTSALGQEAPAGGPVPSAAAAADTAGDPFAGPGPADPGDAAEAHSQAAAAAVHNAPAGGIAGSFSPIVSETRTKAATIAEVATHIEAAGTKEELKGNVRGLALADDRLKAAAADTEEAEALLALKQAEEAQAKDEMERYQAAASEGGLSDSAQDIAKQNTAALSADKRVYLNTRNTYAASTALVAKNQQLLQQAKQQSAAAMQAYVKKKEEAAAARAKAEKLADAMLKHNAATKAEAAVGEESTPDGISRSQAMAEISAAATQQEILAIDVQTEASLLKQAWDDRLLKQKTAQETLDAEVARNAQLAEQSNSEQQDFIDSSHVAAIDATAAADAKKKAAADLLGATKRFAAAQGAREAASSEVQRLADIEEIRRQEFEAQSKMTDSVRAKTDVMTAIEEEAEIATKTEEIKDATNRDAIIKTIETDLETKDENARAQKAAADDAAAIAAANAVVQAAIDKPVPQVVQTVLKMNPMSEGAITAAGETAETSAETPATEAASGPDAAPVASTGVSEAEAQQRAKQMAEAAKKFAAAARSANQDSAKTTA